MIKNRISILSTRPLEDTLINDAEKAGIDIDILSFIETVPAESMEVQQEIEQALTLSAVVAFTSMNAVEAVATHLNDEQPDWKIYSIGTTTSKLVKKYFGEESFAGYANSAVELAELIAEECNIDELIFFCGDQRRDELPHILRNHEIEVNEIVVYQTTEVFHKIQKEYPGILFFSPSAVRSFFKNNIVPEKTILFAIGFTTATEIKKHTKNKIIISDEPGKENLVKKMMDYFGK